MGTKRRIAIAAIKLLIVVGIIAGIGYGVYTGILSLPPPPTKVQYSINIPDYPDATSARYFLKSNVLLFSSNRVYDYHDDKVPLPYSIAGEAVNNTQCTLKVWYYTTKIDPITGSNTQPTIIYQQIADKTYELTITSFDKLNNVSIQKEP
jgi:hypothetical protein